MYSMYSFHTGGDAYAMAFTAIHASRSRELTAESFSMLKRHSKKYEKYTSWTLDKSFELAHSAAARGFEIQSLDGNYRARECTSP